jgi:putative transcriptional regulator
MYLNEMHANRGGRQPLKQEIVMNARRPVACLMFCLAIALPLAFPAVARATESLDEPVILVARPALRDRIYGATILIAKPTNNGRHIGLIINKPTPVTLGKLFPDHPPSQKVTEPVYLGGPVSMEVLFALVQARDNPGGGAMQLTPDLQLVVDRESVDRIIEAGAKQARFFAGVVLWAPGELRAEIDKGFWFVQDADTSLVLRKSMSGLWEELVKRLQQQQPPPPPRGSIRAGL